MSDFKLKLESATPHHKRRPLPRSEASTKGQKPLAFGEKSNFINQIIWKRKYNPNHNVRTCLRHVSMQTAMCQRIGNMPKACPYAMALSFWVVWCGFFTKNSFYYQGFFAVKRRAVFILGAKWIVLVRGWRRDCVVGGMETRFQCRKAHSRTAKCEAFHFAPRLFFMFLFLVPFTIRQQYRIYAPRNFPLSDFWLLEIIYEKRGNLGWFPLLK